MSAPDTLSDSTRTSDAPLMTEQRLSNIFQRHFGDVRLPDPIVWTFAANQIRQFQWRPWSDDDSRILTDGLRRMKRERATLNNAAEILETDAKRFFRNSPDWERRYAEAIQILRMPRGIADDKRQHLSKVSDKGPSMAAWAFVSREILAWIVPELMKCEVPVSSRRTSPLVKSLREILCHIYAPQSVPKHTTIANVVAAYLGT